MLAATTEPRVWVRWSVEQSLCFRRIQLRRRSVRKSFLLFLVCFSVFSMSALAEEWNKSYQVGDKPSLRVDTNDASVEISRGVSRTISARVIADGYNFGGSGVRVTERQDADKVDLQVHVPNSWGVHFSSHRGVRIEVQVPSDTALDLHSGDGHIHVDGTAGQARLDTGDGRIEVRQLQRRSQCPHQRWLHDHRRRAERSQPAYRRRPH